MADKKTTKVASKATKVAKKSTKTTEVKTIDQMRTELTAKQADMITAKRGHKLGELVNPRVLTNTRKEIARLHTAIRAAEIAEQKGSK